MPVTSMLHQQKPKEGLMFHLEEPSVGHLCECTCLYNSPNAPILWSEVAEKFWTLQAKNSFSMFQD